MTANPDMTIRDIRVTMLRLPWADDPWLRGHALGDTRDVLVLDVETAGGITGMGYLFVFRPGMKSIAACLEELLALVAEYRAEGLPATAHELRKRFDALGIACPELTPANLAALETRLRATLARAQA